MAIISNNQSIKGFARFAKSNEEDLTLRFNLKHGVPSFNTFRHILDNISEQIFADNFMIYMKKHYKDWHDEILLVWMAKQLNQACLMLEQNRKTSFLLLVLLGKQAIWYIA